MDTAITMGKRATKRSFSLSVNQTPNLLLDLHTRQDSLPQLSQVLKDEALARLLMEADEHPSGSPFDHISKIQLLVQKGRTEEGIRWAFNAVPHVCNR